MKRADPRSGRERRERGSGSRRTRPSSPTAPLRTGVRATADMSAQAMDGTAAAGRLAEAENGFLWPKGQTRFFRILVTIESFGCGGLHSVPLLTQVQDEELNACSVSWMMTLSVEPLLYHQPS